MPLDPENAIVHDGRYPVPSGWTHSVDADGLVDLVPSDPDNLGSADPDRLYQWWQEWYKMLDAMDWLARGVIPSYSSAFAGTGYPFFTTEFDLQVAYAEGHTLYLTTATDDPGDVEFSITDGTGIYNTRIQAGDSCQIIDYTLPGNQFWNQNLRVVSVEFDTPHSKILVHKPIELPIGDGPYDFKFYRECMRPAFPYIQPFMGEYVSRETSVITDPVGVELLYNGKIAYWYGPDGVHVPTFNVTKNGVNITESVLYNFITKVWVDYGASGWQTWIDLSLYGEGDYNVTFCPCNSSRDGGGWRPAQTMCAHCIIDRTDSFPIRAGSADDGKRWYCQYQDQLDENGNRYAPDAFLAKFHAKCMLTKCPGFDINQPRSMSAFDVGRLMMSRDVFQGLEGEINPTTHYGRAGHPSMHFLAGMPNPTNLGLDPQDADNALSWPTGSTIGRLRVKPAPLDADEGYVEEIIYDAIREDGNGVLQEDYTKSDRQGGIGESDQSIYDDGSDVYAVEKQHCNRNMSEMTFASRIAEPTGRGEYAVQNVTRRKISTSMTKGTGGTANGLSWTYDDDYLIATIAAHGGRDYPSKVNCSVFETTYSAGYVTVDFIPTVQTATYILLGEEEPSAFVSAGNVVQKPPWLMVTNQSAADSYAGQYEKMAKGDTLVVSEGILASFVNVPIPIIWAKSFAGAKYTDFIAGVDPADDPNGSAPGIPAFYSDAGKSRTACDRCVLDITGYEFEGLRTWFGMGNSITFDSNCTVTTEGVLPPEYVFDDGMNDVLTDYEYSVYLDAVLVTSEVDRGSGNIRVPIAEVPSTPFSFRVYDNTGLADPWVYTRENDRPAELVTKPTEQLKKLQWIDGGSFVGGPDISIIDPISGTALAGILSLGWLAPTERYYWADLGGGPAQYPTYLGSYDGIGYNASQEPTQPPAIYKFTPAAMDAKLTGLSPTTISTYTTGVDMGEYAGWESLDLYGYYQTLKLTDFSILGRFHPDWIKSAKIDIKIEDGVESHFVGTFPVPPGSGLVQTDSYDVNLSLAGFWGYEYEIGGVPYYDFKPAGVGLSVNILSNDQSDPSDIAKWYTIDITALAKFCSGVLAEPAYDLYFFVAGAGPNTDSSIEALDIQTLFSKSCNSSQFSTEGYVEGTESTGGGSPVTGAASSSTNYYRLTYSGISLRNLKVEIDHDEMIDSPYLSEIVYDSERAAHMPH